MEARSWYGRAVAAGSAHAMRGLGSMIAMGEGGAADPVTGYAYLTLAEKGGDRLAPVVIEKLAEIFTPEVREAAASVIERLKTSQPPRK